MRCTRRRSRRASEAVHARTAHGPDARPAAPDETGHSPSIKAAHAHRQDGGRTAGSRAAMPRARFCTRLPVDRRFRRARRAETPPTRGDALKRSPAVATCYRPRGRHDCVMPACARPSRSPAGCAHAPSATTAQGSGSVRSSMKGTRSRRLSRPQASAAERQASPAY